MTSPRMSDRTPWWLAGATLLAHLSVAHRYDFFRDELYFVVCGRRPAFGYVDQPPLVPLLSAATQLLGEHLFLLRSLSALAAATTVLVVCALARLVGAGRFGTAAAGVAAAVAPMYLGVMTTVGTSTFEPVLWTAVAYFVARAVVQGEGRAWIWAGMLAGIDLEIKYALPMYLVPLALAIVVTGRARSLWRKEAAIGVALAAVLAAPSAVWQVAHGLPFVEVIRAQATGGKNTLLSPIAFVAQQILAMNPLLAPLWLAGAVAPFVDRRWREWRFLSLAFVLTFALMMALHAKDYYLSPAYGVVFALGGAALESWVRARVARGLWLTSSVALSAVAAPLAMPILNPPTLVRYQRALHLQTQAAETLEQSAIPQTFADMLGWREYTAVVAKAYHALPTDEQRRVAIFAGNYGEAAALDFYGAQYGLPPAIGPHNQYWLWGPRGHDGSVLLRVNEEPEQLARRCQSVALAGRFGTPYAMPFETDAPITLCHGLHPPLSELWPLLKFYY